LCRECLDFLIVSSVESPARLGQFFEVSGKGILHQFIHRAPGKFHVWHHKPSAAADTRDALGRAKKIDHKRLEPLMVDLKAIKDEKQADETKTGAREEQVTGCSKA